MEHHNREEIIRRYVSGESSLALSNEFKIHRRYIARWVTNSGGTMRNPRRNGKLSLAEKLALAEEYSTGARVSLLSEKYGILKSGIPDVVHQMGGKIRTSGFRVRTVRENIFDVITEESAYWIGFLMADGCIARVNGRPTAVIVTLSEIDLPHLEKLKNFLGFDGKIKRNPASAIRGTKYHRNTSCTLAVSSSALARSLEKYGIVPAKTFIAKVFLLENDRHFWRGVVDGDGCIREGVDGKSPYVGLMGSAMLMRQFAEFISASDGMTIPPVWKCKNVTNVGIQGHRGSFVAKLLYENCTVALDRKLAKANVAMKYNRGPRANSYPPNQCPQKSATNP